MLPDEKVYATPVTIEIELTGDQVHALSRAADQHCLAPEASKLVREIAYIYDEHISYHPITPEDDE